MLLYIHGLNSSPLSEKGQLTAAFMAQYYPQIPLVQPQLPTDPQSAMALLEQIVTGAKQAGEPLTYIGSSLGGFFATYLAHTYGGRAALINPVVSSATLVETFIGSEQYNPYTDERYIIAPETQATLMAYDPQVILDPDRFFVLLQTGDQVLDYKLAVQKYHCCQMLIQPGGDHSFSGYKDQLTAICDFLQLDK